MVKKIKVNKIICLLLSICMLLAFAIPVSAEEKNKECFFEEFYSGKFDIMVEDKNGNNVTEYFLNKTRDLYNSNNINVIKEIMANENLKAHIYKASRPVVNTFAAEEYKTVSDFFAEYYKDDTYGTVMEFTATLTGGIWYNPTTQKVTRTSSPTFNVNYMMAPSGITPFCNEIQTGSNVSNGKGYFWATYTCSGQASIDGLYYIAYDYGRHTSSFYATP